VHSESHQTHHPIDHHPPIDHHHPIDHHPPIDHPPPPPLNQVDLFDSVLLSIGY